VTSTQANLPQLALTARRDIHWIWIDLVADGDSYLVTEGRRGYIYTYIHTWPAGGSVASLSAVPLSSPTLTLVVSREEGSRGAVVNIRTDYSGRIEKMPDPMLRGSRRQVTCVHTPLCQEYTRQTYVVRILDPFLLDSPCRAR